MISKHHMAGLSPARHNTTSSSVASLTDIFNVDESGLFYHQIQAKFLILAGDPCKGGKGKKNKECITIIFGCSARG